MLLIQIVVFGVLLGAVYALASLGLGLTFGVLHILNFAHGVFIVLGALMTYSLAESGLPILVAMLIATVTTGAVGWLVQRLVIERVLEYTSFMVLVVTVGLAIVGQEVISHIWGSSEVYLRVFTGDASSQQIGSLRLPTAHLVASAVAIAASGLLFWVLDRTETGRHIRACRDDPEAALIVGINVPRVRAATVAVSAAWAAIAGGLIVMLEPVAAHHAIFWIINAFIIVVLAGMGSMGGILVAGLIVGVIISLSQFYVGSAWSRGILFGVLMAMLLWRPQGLFGVKEVVRK